MRKSGGKERSNKQSSACRTVSNSPRIFPSNGRPIAPALNTRPQTSIILLKVHATPVAVIQRNAAFISEVYFGLVPVDSFGFGKAR